MIKTQEELKASKERIRACGLKATPQRLGIFKALAKTKKHPDAEFIYNGLKAFFPTLSLATVYSTLKCFRKTGLIKEAAAFVDTRHFDYDTRPHSHLVCIRCHKIEDADNLDEREIKRLENLTAKKSNYKLLETSISFQGYCPACKPKSK